MTPKPRKVRRVVLGEGYLSYHISGRSVAILVAGTRSSYAFDPRQVELQRLPAGADHSNVRLIAEFVSEDR